MEKTGSFGHVCSSCRLKEKIQKIYEDSIKTTVLLKLLQNCGNPSVFEKTVGNYMRQMGIKAQWVKPDIQTTIDSDFSQELKNILNEDSIHAA